MIDLTFAAPTGNYSLVFEEEPDAYVAVRHGAVAMTWSAFVADGDGVVQGMTSETEELWGDTFWWVLTLGPPATIEYFVGEGVLVRKDMEVTP